MNQRESYQRGSAAGKKAEQGNKTYYRTLDGLREENAELRADLKATVKLLADERGGAIEQQTTIDSYKAALEKILKLDGGISVEHSPALFAAINRITKEALEGDVSEPSI